MMSQPGLNYEMNSLLNLRKGPGSVVHSIGSHYATAQQQSVMVPPYSPHTSTDPSEMCHQINSIPESQVSRRRSWGNFNSRFYVIGEGRNYKNRVQSRIELYFLIQLTMSSVLGEDNQRVVYIADCNGYCIGGKTMKVAVETLRIGANQIESASFQEEIRVLAAFTHLNVIRLLGVTYLENSRLGACFDFAVHGDLISWLKIREPSINE